MKLSARSAALYSATFAGLLMLSACGKSEQPASTPPAASTAAAPAAPTPASTAPAPASTAAAPMQAPAPSTTAAAAPAAPVAAPVSNTAAAPVAGDLKVAGLTLGGAVSPDHKVSKAKTTFAPGDKSIYASVATEGNTDGATLSAKWSYLEGKGQLVNSTSQSIATDGPATTTFRVQNPNNWPEGKYKVEIAVNGKSVATQNFEVKKG
ncbi:hypothetical protein [Dyella sp. GSA-30]|uniref:hypothetical protein n=1 Tax=Dyella sp. GSA-30 TaxID=2994496 RepID=UPI0024917A9D|nr:hypothetical protein [Dyella sp. GSA-30]BDU19630.1 hypothetical protein DYGSA30_10870 [Dyella sp. GSA-30]